MLLSPKRPPLAVHSDASSPPCSPKQATPVHVRKARRRARNRLNSSRLKGLLADRHDGANAHNLVVAGAGGDGTSPVLGVDGLRLRKRASSESWVAEGNKENSPNKQRCVDHEVLGKLRQAEKLNAALSQQLREEREDRQRAVRAIREQLQLSEASAPSLGVAVTRLVGGLQRLRTTSHALHKDNSRLLAKLTQKAATTSALKQALGIPEECTDADVVAKLEGVLEQVARAEKDNANLRQALEDKDGLVAESSEGLRAALGRVDSLLRWNRTLAGALVGVLVAFVAVVALLYCPQVIAMAWVL